MEPGEFTVEGLLVCDTVIQDAESGKRSYIGVFETIHSPVFPAQHRKFYVCFRMQGSGQHNLVIQIIGPKGVEDGMITQAGVAQLPREGATVDQAVPFVNVVLPHEGEYSVRLLEDDKMVASTKFKCRKKGE